jgi:hypothetical protein
LHRQFGKHHALIGPDPDILSIKDMPVSQWPKFRWFSSTNTIFPNSVVGSGGPNKILFFQRCEPAEKVGVSNYKFRVYTRRDSTAEEKAARPQIIELFMKVALEEDMAVQRSSQIMMEEGAVPSLVFGKREINLTRMHKEYDAVIGHDNEASVRATAQKMGLQA